MPLIKLTTFVKAPLERVFDLSRSIDLLEMAKPLLLLSLPAGLSATQVLELGRHWEADAWRTALGVTVPHATCADRCSGSRPASVSETGPTAWVRRPDRARRPGEGDLVGLQRPHDRAMHHRGAPRT